MKKLLLILLLVGLNVNGADPKINDTEVKQGKEGRVHVRMPYDLTLRPNWNRRRLPPKQNNFENQWKKWWSYQVCGYCKELADKCWWLKRQKGNIKRTWTKTIISKEIPVRFIRLGNKGNPQGFALTTKSGKIVKIRTTQ